MLDHNLKEFGNLVIDESISIRSKGEFGGQSFSCLSQFKNLFLLQAGHIPLITANFINKFPQKST